MNQPQHPGFRSVAYYVNWAIYGRKHRPQDLPVEKLTHVLYSFANVKENGEVVLTDLWSDIDIHWEGDSWNDPPGARNVYGCIKQLNLLKKRNRNLKVLLSIGGWTYAHDNNCFRACSTEAGRKTFATSVVQLLKDHGFDGVDVDWEYPKNDQEAKEYVELLATIRRELDNYSESLRHREIPHTHFELTIAAPAGSQHYQWIYAREMSQYIDFVNLMGYDYAGSWDQVAGHQANLYPDHHKPGCTPFSTQAAIDYYLSNGIPPHKMVIGMPLYGRAFLNTDGPGQPFNGVGSPDQDHGSWEAGVWEFKALPRPGAQEHHDTQVGAAWSYCPATRTMISYDTADVARQKVDYIRDGNLGGAMWWESSADKSGSESLVAAVYDRLSHCGSGIEQRTNVIAYPDSKYPNLREGFPEN